MLYEKRFLSEKFLQEHQLNSHSITTNDPLVLVCSTKFTFLNFFTSTILDIANIPYQKTLQQQCDLMGFSMPAIGYKNALLHGDSLVEFLSEIFLNSKEQNQANCLERKTLTKTTYHKWLTVLRDFHEGNVNFYHLKKIGIHDKEDLHNHVYGSLLQIVSMVAGHILAEKYPTFRPEKVNLETILIHDIVDSIINLCAKTEIDFILRSEFQILMAFHQKFPEVVARQKELNDRNEPLRPIETEVLFLERPSKNEPQLFQTARWNPLRFSVTFIMVAGLYAYCSK